ncbi:organic cation transporter protein-like isoform X2 [Harmonia axyridis]|uniref:organic cation transporter protein-like isoform X2 n=1 Tax=Harmonia axyridis TaxID=115357 RepID=UPI001E2793FD|nr:organic cation transporter protein-like isoform X2 [Harmonia axyridis]
MLSPLHGDFGPYQQWQYALCVISVIVSGMQMYSLLTVAAIPEHRCEIPHIDVNKTMTELNFTTLTRYIPLKTETQIDSCHIYDTITNESVKCNSWVYNTTYHPSSRAIEWNFVCDRRWMGAVSQTTFMLGIFLGNILLGNLADRIGRKPVFCCTALMTLLFGVGVAFTTDFYMFLAMKFVLGMAACAGSTLAGFVMTMELVGPSRRSVVGIGFQVFFAIGIVLVAFWGYLIKDRQQLQIIYGLHSLPLVFHWWLLDESPRWLWAKGRYRESLEIIQKALRFNGSKMILDMEKLIPKESALDPNKSQNDTGLLESFKRPNLRTRILNVGFMWFGNSLVYYGLSLSTKSMKGNPFLVIFIMGIIELPADLLVVIFLDRMGRRFITSFNMIISGLCCVLAVAFTIGSLTSNILVYLGKFTIAASFSAIYIYSAELFPTMIRNSAMGFASMCARISGSLTPFITLLDSFDPKIPCIIFGVITIFSGFLVVFLPETVGTDMPTTIEDGEKFGIGDTCFSNFFARKQMKSYKVNDEISMMEEQLETLNVKEKI